MVRTSNVAVTDFHLPMPVVTSTYSLVLLVSGLVSKKLDASTSCDCQNIKRSACLLQFFSLCGLSKLSCELTVISLTMPVAKVLSGFGNVSFICTILLSKSDCSIAQVTLSFVFDVIPVTNQTNKAIVDRCSPRCKKLAES